MAAAAPDTWMPLWIGPYLANTLHLNRAQHGSYCLLIMACWKAGGRLPATDDVLATIAKCTPREWRTERTVFAAFFDVDAEWWTHPRVVIELEKARGFKDKQTGNGRKGGRPRKPKITQSETQTETQDKPKPKPKSKPNETTSPSPSSTVTTIESVASSASENPDESHDAGWEPEAGDYERQSPVGRAQPIPRNWQPSAEDIDWAATARPDLAPARLKLETDGFKNHAIGNNRTAFEWGPLWRNWVMKAKIGDGRSGGGPAPSNAGAILEGAMAVKDHERKGILDR